MAKKSEGKEPLFDADMSDIPIENPGNQPDPNIDLDNFNFNDLPHTNPLKNKDKKSAKKNQSKNHQSVSKKPKQSNKKLHTTKQKSVKDVKQNDKKPKNSHQHSKSQTSNKGKVAKSSKNKVKIYKKDNKNKGKSKVQNNNKSRYYKKNNSKFYHTNVNNNRNNKYNYNKYNKYNNYKKNYKHNTYKYKKSYSSPQQQEVQKIEEYRKQQLHKLFTPPKLSKDDIKNLTPQKAKQLKDNYNKQLYVQSNKLAPDTKSQKYNDGKNVAKQIIRGDVSPNKMNTAQLASFKTYESWQKMQNNIMKLSKKFAQHIDKVTPKPINHKPQKRTEHLHIKPFSKQEIKDAQQRTLNQIRQYHKQNKNNSKLHRFYQRLSNNKAIKRQRLTELKRKYLAKQKLLSNAYINNDLYTGINHYGYNKEQFKNAHKNEKLRYKIKKKHPSIVTENQLTSFCEKKFYQEYPELKDLRNIKGISDINKAVQERHQIFMKSRYSIPIDSGMNHLNQAYNVKQINGLNVKESVKSANQFQGLTSNANQPAKTGKFDRFLTRAQQRAKRVIGYISTSPAVTSLAKKIGLRTRYEDVKQNQGYADEKPKKNTWTWGQEQDKERVARHLYGNSMAMTVRQIYNAKQKGQAYQNIESAHPNVVVFNKAYQKYLNKPDTMTKQPKIKTKVNTSKRHVDEAPKPKLHRSKDVKAIKELRQNTKDKSAKIKAKSEQKPPKTRMQRLHNRIHNKDIER